MAERRLLNELAFLMLGSEKSAEHVVRMTYLRWYFTADEEKSPSSPPRWWLIRSVSRACLRILKSSPSGADGDAEDGKPTGNAVV
ncbi:hypothetical protein [Saccharopolyspora sp. 5N708]|uniref:hypothetical protein n=1 Tax=Saccharopolyspora sp. 5N708 TaxID=3457424 RepID=UPI003FD4DFF9